MIIRFIKLFFIVTTFFLLFFGTISAETKTELQLESLGNNNHFVKPCSNDYYYIPGDIEESGELTVGDAISVLRYVVGLATLHSNTIQIADVNFDGTVDVNDAILILRKIVGLDTISSVNNPALVSTENALKYIIENTNADVEMTSDIHLEFADMVFLNRPLNFEGNDLFFHGIIVINTHDVVINNLNIYGKIDFSDRESYVRESGSKIMSDLAQVDELKVVLNNINTFYLIVEAGNFNIEITGESSIYKVLVYSDVTINGSDKTGSQYYREAVINRPDSTEPHYYTSQMVSFKVGAGDINNHFPLANTLIIYYCIETDIYFSLDLTATDGMVNKSLPPGDYWVFLYHNGYFVRQSQENITEKTEGVSTTYYLIPESEGGNLEVTIIDAVTGDAVKNASVEIEGSSYNREKITDSEGRLCFFAPRGSYDLHISHDSYWKTIIEVSISTGSNLKSIEIDPLGEMYNVTGTIYLPIEAQGKQGVYYLLVTPDCIEEEHGRFFFIEFGSWLIENEKIEYSGTVPEGTYYLYTLLEYEDEDEVTVNLVGLNGGYYPEDIPEDPNVIISTEQDNIFDINSESFGLLSEE